MDADQIDGPREKREQTECQTRSRHHRQSQSIGSGTDREVDRAPPSTPPHSCASQGESGRPIREESRPPDFSCGTAITFGYQLTLFYRYAMRQSNKLTHRYGHLPYNFPRSVIPEIPP